MAEIGLGLDATVDVHQGSVMKPLLFFISILHHSQLQSSHIELSGSSMQMTCNFMSLCHLAPLKLDLTSWLDLMPISWAYLTDLNLNWGSKIQLSGSIKIIGATLNSDLTTGNHTKALPMSCFYHIQSKANLLIQGLWIYGSSHYYGYINVKFDCTLKHIAHLQQAKCTWQTCNATAFLHQPINFSHQSAPLASSRVAHQV